MFNQHSREDLVKIRPTIREDYNSIVNILKRTDHFTAEEIEVADELLNSYFDLSSQSGYWTFTAVDEKVAGYVCYGPTPLTVGTYDIYWIAVDPELQGRRIGTESLTFAENDIEAQGKADHTLHEFAGQVLFHASFLRQARLS